MKKNYRENYPRAAETFASELLNVRCFNVKRDIRRPTENNRKLRCVMTDIKDSLTA